MPTSTVPHALATATGRTLAGGLGAVAAITRRKPLHARGHTHRGILTIDAPLPDLDVPLLADRGLHPCVIRLSRAMSTPEGWWDIGGFALRVDGAGPGSEPADLLFASTGTGRLGRHVLRFTRRPLREPMSTLLPVRAGESSLLLLVRPHGPSADGGVEGRSDAPHPMQFELSAGLDDGSWRPVGLIGIGLPVDDASPRFDPLVRRLDGTVPPTWVTALREPAYRVARRLGRRAPSGCQRRPAQRHTASC
jgi:hypothetical protein